MQETYWKKLTQYKFSLYYFDAHMAKCVKISRNIKIMCAVASSAAIAAWATCQQLSFWWGLIIAASQVLIAVNEFLPYTKRIQELSNMKAALTPVYNKMEKEWFYVSNGLITEEEINKRMYSFVQQWESIIEGYLVEDALPQDKDCIDKAQAANEIYFTTNF